MASMSNHGTICWLEIPVLSASRAALFYTTVFGWDCSVPSADSLHSGAAAAASSSSLHTWPSLPTNGSNNGQAAATVHTFHQWSSGHDGSHTSSSLNGAFIQVPEGCLIRSCEAETGEMAVLTTFAVESIDETLRKVVEMGGRMHSPRTLIGRNMGSFARFIDCEGNLHGIWASH